MLKIQVIFIAIKIFSMENIFIIEVKNYDSQRVVQKNHLLIVYEAPCKNTALIECVKNSRKSSIISVRLSDYGYLFDRVIDHVVDRPVVTNLWLEVFNDHIFIRLLHFVNTTSVFYAQMKKGIAVLNHTAKSDESSCWSTVPESAANDRLIEF